MRKVKERTLEQRIQPAGYTRTVKQVEKECPICRRSFWGAKISRYCSRACRNRANYERHENEYRQRRLEKYYGEKQSNGK